MVKKRTRVDNVVPNDCDFLADSEREGAKDTLKRAQPYRRTDDAYARAGSRERQQLRKLKHLKVAAVMCGKLRRLRSSRMIVIFFN